MKGKLMRKLVQTKNNIFFHLSFSLYLIYRMTHSELIFGHNNVYFSRKVYDDLKRFAVVIDL